MKRKILLITFICTITKNFAAENQLPAINLIVHIHNSPINNQGGVSVTTEQTTVQESDQKQKIELSTPIQSQATDAQQSLKLLNHPMYCTIGTAITACAAFTIYAFYLHHSITSKHCWSRWKHHIPLHELALWPITDLRTELLRSIALKYKIKGEKSLSPFMLFYFFEQEINAELSKLERYEQIQKITEYPPLRWIITIWKKDKQISIQERKNRLLFIHRLAHQYLNEQFSCTTTSETI